jgi:hypothetical protein
MNYLTTELENIESSLERQHRFNLDMYQVVTRILGIYENMQQSMHTLYRRQTIVHNEISILSAIQRQQTQRTPYTSTTNASQSTSSAMSTPLSSSSSSNRRWEFTRSPLSRPSTPLFTSINNQRTTPSTHRPVDQSRNVSTLSPLSELGVPQNNFMSPRNPSRSARSHTSQQRPSSSTSTSTSATSIASATGMERLTQDITSMINSFTHTALGINTSTHPDASFSTSIHVIPLNLDSTTSQTIRNEDWINNLNLSPVIVRPTEEEIARALTNIRYSSAIEQRIDPIDQIQFTNNEELVRLNHCGHVFRSVNIRTWFHNSVYCPLCRIDVRDPVPISETQQRNTEQLNENDEEDNNDIADETDNENGRASENDDTSDVDMEFENALHYYSDDSVERI